MTVTIREFRYGDMGAIVTAQTRYYAAAEGWSGGMEALLLEVTGEFVRRHVAGRSNCWIAERGGEPVASIFCFDAGEGVAQLRLMYVDSAVRGLGVGRELIARCVDFARASGYRKLMLWTHSNLLTARALYAKAGFVLTATEDHHEFGVAVHGETWVLPLAKA